VLRGSVARARAASSARDDPTGPHYRRTESPGYPDGDLDQDGDVDLEDLAALLAVYRGICP